MGIKSEIQSLSPSALIELFEIDMTNLEGGDVLRFHAGTNKLQQPVVWQGIEYTPLPIEAEGFDLSSKGTLPRPKVRIANVDGLLSAEVRKNDDLVGCKVTRRRTLAKYLDAVNFPDGNPSADPSQSLPDDVWFVERKVNENRYIIEWELASAFDLQGVMLPFRQVIQNTCMWEYRGPECRYDGVLCYDKNDQLTDPKNDFCAKRMSSCEVRHGVGAILPYGGFPGAVRVGK